MSLGFCDLDLALDVLSLTNTYFSVVVVIAHLHLHGGCVCICLCMFYLYIPMWNPLSKVAFKIEAIVLPWVPVRVLHSSEARSLQSTCHTQQLQTKVMTKPFHQTLLKSASSLQTTEGQNRFSTLPPATKMPQPDTNTSTKPWLDTTNFRISSSPIPQFTNSPAGH